MEALTTKAVSSKEAGRKAEGIEGKVGR